MQARLNKRGRRHRTARSGGSEQPVPRLSPLPPQTEGNSTSAALPNCFTSSEQRCTTQMKSILKYFFKKIKTVNANYSEFHTKKPIRAKNPDMLLQTENHFHAKL